MVVLSFKSGTIKTHRIKLFLRRLRIRRSEGAEARGLGRTAGTALSFSWKDNHFAFFVLDYANSYLSWGFAYSPLPNHTVRLLAQRNLSRLHPLRDELSKKPDCSGGSFLSGSIPYSSKIEVVEFLFDDLKLLFLRRSLFFSARFLGFRCLDLLYLFSGLWKCFGPLLDLRFQRLDFFRLF